MNRAQLKELVKNIMSEESEYQAFFQKALEKAGKSIPSMSDDEKKAFFNKIDSAWDGKGEKNEGNAFGAAVTAAKKAGEDEFEVGGETYKVEEKLVGGQKKLDVDKDGDIEGDDLADLRASKNEARDDKGNEFPELEDVKMAVKKIMQNNDVERLLRNKVIAYLQKEKGFTGAGNTNSSRLYDKVINDLLKH
jgi:hypothetical protein